MGRINTRMFALLLSFCVFFVFSFNVFAEDEPAFAINKVVPGEKVTLLAKNFPSHTQFTASMADSEKIAVFIDVAIFDTKEGVPFYVTLDIPQELSDAKNITLILHNETGVSITGGFSNEKIDNASDIQLSLGAPAVAESEGTMAPPMENIPSSSSAQCGVSGCAPAILIPSLVIESVSPGKSVQVKGIDFPAAQVFSVKIGLLGDVRLLGNNGQFAQDYYSGSGGSFTLDIAIPENLASSSPLSIRFESQEGYYAFNWFTNIAPAMDSAPQPGNSDAQVDASLSTCNFSVFPSFLINEVVKGKTVVIATKDFPANSSFTVKMGSYADFGIIGGSGTVCPGCQTTGRASSSSVITPTNLIGAPGFWQYPISYLIQTAPSSSSTFISLTMSKGVDAGEIQSGDGSPQTITLNIPESINDYNPIVIWVEDKGPCGFYAYNYFWNRDTNDKNSNIVETQVVAGN